MKFATYTRSLMICGIILMPSLVFGQVLFDFEYADVDNNTGIGFDDPRTGEASRRALQEVANYIGQLLGYEAKIIYTIRSSQTDGSGSLASAGSSYGLLEGANSVRDSNLAMAIQGLSSRTTQGYMTVDFGFEWNFSTDAPTERQYDFRSVILHEMTHSLGLTSLIDERTGEGSSVTQNGKYFGQTYSTFDSHITDGDGNPLILRSAEFDSARFTDGRDEDEVIDIFTSDNIFFNGPNAVAVYGAPVPLYSPGLYLSGSSTSHLDSGTPALDNDPLAHSIGRGESKREYTDLDIAILQDLGYTAIVVPEPTTGALLGLALVTIFGYRRR